MTEGSAVPEGKTRACISTHSARLVQEPLIIPARLVQKPLPLSLLANSMCIINGEQSRNARAHTSSCNAFHKHWHPPWSPCMGLCTLYTCLYVCVPTVKQHTCCCQERNDALKHFLTSQANRYHIKTTQYSMDGSTIYNPLCAPNDCGLDFCMAAVALAYKYWCVKPLGGYIYTPQLPENTLL